MSLFSAVSQSSEISLAEEGSFEPYDSGFLNH